MTFPWMTTYGSIIGIASYYKDFVEAVYQLLEGQASMTGKDHKLSTVSVYWTQTYTDEVPNTFH